MNSLISPGPLLCWVKEQTLLEETVTQKSCTVMINALLRLFFQRSRLLPFPQSSPMDLLGVQSNINGSKPDTYYTKDELGLDVTASSRPDLIASVIPTSMLLVIQNNYGINLLDPNDLDALVTMLMGISFAIVAPGGSSAGTVNVGTPGDPKVVVVNGNFDLNGNGAGILVVIGQLTFRGNVNYDGIVLVIGEGYMKRNGGGNGTISGGILVANTANFDPWPRRYPWKCR